MFKIREEPEFLRKTCLLETLVLLGTTTAQILHNLKGISKPSLHEYKLNLLFY